MIVSMFSASCMSYKPVSDTNRIASNHEPPLKAYVLNAEEYKPEFKILKYSKKYDLVKDSASADVAIQLKKMKTYPIGCLTPQFTAMLFTLGFYPVRFLERYVYEYDEIHGSNKQSIQQKVGVEKTVSWFHLFSFKKNRKKAIGKSL